MSASCARARIETGAETAVRRGARGAPVSAVQDFDVEVVIFISAGELAKGCIADDTTRIGSECNGDGNGDVLQHRNEAQRRGLKDGALTLLHRAALRRQSRKTATAGVKIL